MLVNAYLKKGNANGKRPVKAQPLYTRDKGFSAEAGLNEI